MTYEPRPIPTADIALPASLLELTERLAENTHEVWAKRRLADGWTYGPRRDDGAKSHPCLVPYAELPESEKDYDRATAMETLKAILSLGYRIVPPP
jgi:ryanodine receptor 2